jgi:hypothetical protein
MLREGPYAINDIQAEELCVCRNHETPFGLDRLISTMGSWRQS